MKSKKGSIFDLFVLIAVTLVMVVFFAVYFFGFTELTNKLVEVEIQDENINFSNITLSTLGNVTNGLATLKWFSFAMIVAMFLSLFISNYFIKSHPIFFIVSILITIVAIVFSVAVSNAYELLLSGNAISDTLMEFTATNFIMLNLPLIIGVVGIMATIFLFVAFPRDPELGGGIS